MHEYLIADYLQDFNHSDKRAIALVNCFACHPCLECNVSHLQLSGTAMRGVALLIVCSTREERRGCLWTKIFNKQSETGAWNSSGLRAQEIGGESSWHPESQANNHFNDEMHGLYMEHTSAQKSRWWQIKTKGCTLEIKSVDSRHNDVLVINNFFSFRKSRQRALTMHYHIIDHSK